MLSFYSLLKPRTTSAFFSLLSFFFSLFFSRLVTRYCDNQIYTRTVHEGVFFFLIQYTDISTVINLCETYAYQVPEINQTSRQIKKKKNKKRKGCGENYWFRFLGLLSIIKKKLLFLCYTFSIYMSKSIVKKKKKTKSLKAIKPGILFHCIRSRQMYMVHGDQVAPR